MEQVAEKVIDRSRYLGGSDIGAILGVNRYRTALDVFNEKTGRQPAFEGNVHTERGTRLEAIAAEEYREKTGATLIRRASPLVHSEHDFLGGHVDRKIVGQRAIVEIKCPSLGAFSKIKREGLREDYIAQMQWYLGLGDYEYGDWVIFCADQWETITFRVLAEPALYADMVRHGVEFWRNHIVAGIAPTPTETDAALVEFQRAEGTLPFAERTDAEFKEAMALLAEAKRLTAEAEIIEEDAKERVKSLIADKPGIYVCPGARLSLTVARGRSSFDKAALGKAYPEIDLKKFEKTGAPYTVMKATFYGRD
jgi:putative phage-type endonuclease